MQVLLKVVFPPAPLIVLRFSEILPNLALSYVGKWPFRSCGTEQGSLRPPVPVSSLIVHVHNCCGWSSAHTNHFKMSASFLKVRYQERRTGWVKRLVPRNVDALVKFSVCNVASADEMDGLPKIQARRWSDS